jgi:hypothetical protein
MWTMPVERHAPAGSDLDALARTSSSWPRAVPPRRAFGWVPSHGYGRATQSPWLPAMASCRQPGERPSSQSRLRPAGASRDHDTHRLHAMAPGLVGQTIEQAAGHPRMRTVSGAAQAKPPICGQAPAVWSWNPVGRLRRGEACCGPPVAAQPATGEVMGDGWRWRQALTKINSCGCRRSRTWSPRPRRRSRGG